MQCKRVISFENTSVLRKDIFLLVEFMLLWEIPRLLLQERNILWSSVINKLIHSSYIYHQGFYRPLYLRVWPMRSYILRKVKGKHGRIIIIIVSVTQILLDFSEHIFLRFLLIDSFHYIHYIVRMHFHYFLCCYKILVFLTFPTIDLFHRTPKNLKKSNKYVL